MSIRVAIADDHAILRQGLAQLLRSADGIELVAEASDGPELLELVLETRPDVAVSDVSMPTFGAQVLAEKLADTDMATKIVALTVHDEPEIALPILNAGASGYVLKKNAFEELLQAIRAVHDGGRFVSAIVAGNLITPAKSDSPVLSDRERDVLAGLSSGWPYKRIASELDISVRTVETYRERLLKKLDLSTTADLIRFAARQNLLK